MKYIVTIEETVAQDFEIETDSIETAIDKSIKNYKNGKFILEPGEVIGKQLLICSDNCEKIMEWIEF